MSVRTSLRLTAVGAVTALALGASALPGGSQTEPSPGHVTAVGGHATGAYSEFLVESSFLPPSDVEGAVFDASTLAALVDPDADVGAEELVPFIAGPAPTVTLPPEGGGPFTDSLAELDLTIGTTTATIASALEVSTEGSLGPSGRVVSSATMAEYNPAGFDTFGIAAEVVDVECSSDLAGGPVGSTTLTNGFRVVDDVVPVDELPAPNTVAFDDTFTESGPDGSTITIEALVVLNEQVVGANDITVRGAHTTMTVTITEEGGPPLLLETVENIAGEVSCGVVPGAVVEPTFTG